MATLDDFLRAIYGQESGGNYGAVNRSSGALGRYQILAGNVRPWAKQYLGMSVTPQQFLSNPGLQDRLARAVLGSYVKRYGFRGAASAWYSGNPNLHSSTRPQPGGPSIKGYVDSVMRRMGTSPSQVAAESRGIGMVREMTGIDKAPGLPAEDVTDVAPGQPLGIDLETGTGSGMAGIEAPTGPGSTTGTGISLNEDPAKNPLEIPASSFEPKIDMTAPDTAPVSDGARVSPVPGYKPEGAWGHYASGGQHLALDFAVPMGTTVRAPMSGTIVSAGWESGGFGLAVRIKNSDGTYTILGHLSRLTGIKPGMTIKAGQALALSGSTGRSTGPHLHMEMRRSLYDPRSAFNFSGMFKW